jgi:hypothetical protein
VLAWVPLMFCDFYLVKNQKTPFDSMTTKAKLEKKNKYRFGIIGILEIFLFSFG